MKEQSVFITDLDHTFLRSDLSISSFSKKVWNLKAEKHILSVATARSFTKTKKLLSSLALNVPMVLLDGAMVATMDNQIIALNTLDQKLGDAVVNTGIKYGIYPFVIGLKDSSPDEVFLYPKKRNSHQEQVLKEYKDDPRLQYNPQNQTLPKNLKIVYFGEEKELVPFAKMLREDFGNAIECKLSPEKYGGGYFLTILHPRGDKAHALQTLSEYLEKDLSFFTVFGDSVNDLGMFQSAGKAVAVSNALEEVKVAADVILEHSNDEDAVARYLLQNMLPYR